MANRVLGTQGIPMCCTGIQLQDFGEDDRNGNSTPWDEGALRKEINKQLEIQQKYGYAFVVIYLTEQQKIARRVLYKMGFNYSKWMRETRHKGSEKNLRIYWMGLEDWKKEDK